MNKLIKAKDIPLKSIITFTDVPSSVTPADLLELGFSYRAILRNIPIQEQQVSQKSTASRHK